MGSHCHHNSVVLEIGDWLQKQLVLSANQFSYAIPVCCATSFTAYSEQKYFLIASMLAFWLPLLTILGIGVAGV